LDGDTVSHQDCTDATKFVPDARAGTWPPNCATALAQLVLDTVNHDMGERPVALAMVAVVHRLESIVRDHCPPIAGARVAQLHEQLAELYTHRMGQEYAARRVRARAACISCDEKVPDGGGIVCASNHALCDECFNASVHTQTSMASFDAFVRHEAKLACLYCQPQAVLPPAMLVQGMQRLDAASQVAYQCARDEYAVRQERARFLKEIAILQAQVASGGADAAQRIRQHLVRIAEEVMILHCPKCHLPTVGDWEACFKVSCGGCNGTFCAWCLQTPADHAHVKDCASNPHRGSVYGTLQEWAAVRKPTRVAQMRAYLRDHVRADDWVALVAALAAQLAHAGIRASEIDDAAEPELVLSEVCRARAAAV
jgi:hypothetical protein